MAIYMAFIREACYGTALRLGCPVPMDARCAMVHEDLDVQEQGRKKGLSISGVL